MNARSLLVRNLLHQKTNRGHVALLMLVSLLISYSLVFVDSMIDGIIQRLCALSSGTVLVDGMYTSDDPDLDVQPVAEAPALLYGTESTHPVLVKGVDASYFTGMRSVAYTVTAKEPVSGRAIRLGAGLADKAGLSCGDKVLVALQTETRLQPLLCTVDAVIDTGYAELDERLAFVDREVLEPFGLSTHTEVLTTLPADQVCADIEAQGFSAHPWYEETGGIAENLVTSQRVVLLMILLVIALSAFFISEFSSTLVEQHRKDIAMLKLLGAPDGMVLGGLLAATFLLSLLAVLSGMLLGIAASYLSKPLLERLSRAQIPGLSYYLLVFSIRIPWKRLAGISALLLATSMGTCCIVFARTLRIKLGQILD